MIAINNTTKNKINISLIKKTVEIFYKKYKIKNKEISIGFVGDVKIKKLNNLYRKKNKITDVLSFEGEGNDLGEIIIDYAQIKRQAKKYKHSDKQELIYILVHGLLHLVGHEDETEKGSLEMKKLGEKFIKQIILK